MSALFKGLAWIFIILCGAVTILTLAMASSGRAWLSPGILIPIAIICWIVFRKRRKVSVPEVPAVVARPVSVGESLAGVGATIEIRKAGLAITRLGRASLLVHGMKGEKLLPFRSITAVQLKEPGRSMSGYIQFSLVGAIENGRGIWDASKDENTVLFTLEHLPQFLGLRDLVEQQPGAAANPEIAASTSRAQELAILAGLRDAGHLSEEEFSAEKSRILVS